MIDAEHAFNRARRGTRRCKRAFRGGSDLPVVSATRITRRRWAGFARSRSTPSAGTLEPSRAAQFDGAFRPVRRVLRTRWERIWIAEERGTLLPPISVVPVGTMYAVRDGHHRVSVARARGAIAIDGVVEAA